MPLSVTVSSRTPTTRPNLAALYQHRPAHGSFSDAHALIAAERSDRLLWSLHRAALTGWLTPTVPAGVLGEAWRGGPQPQLSRQLKGCLVEPLTEAQARAIGVLAARSGLADTVNLAVAEGALRRGDAVVTSNRSHIGQAAGGGARRRLAIHDVQVDLTEPASPQ